jgi:hypothetical protein
MDFKILVRATAQIYPGAKLQLLGQSIRLLSSETPIKQKYIARKFVESCHGSVARRLRPQ